MMKMMTMMMLVLMMVIMIMKVEKYLKQYANSGLTFNHHDIKQTCSVTVLTSLTCSLFPTRDYSHWKPYNFSSWTLMTIPSRVKSKMLILKSLGSCCFYHKRQLPTWLCLHAVTTHWKYEAMRTHAHNTSLRYNHGFMYYQRYIYSIIAHWLFIAIWLVQWHPFGQIPRKHSCVLKIKM